SILMRPTFDCGFKAKFTLAILRMNPEGRFSNRPDSAAGKPPLQFRGAQRDLNRGILSPKTIERGLGANGLADRMSALRPHCRYVVSPSIRCNVCCCSV